MRYKIGDRVKNICDCGCAKEEGQEYGVVEKVADNGNFNIRFDGGGEGTGYTNSLVELVSRRSIVPEELFALWVNTNPTLTSAK